VDLSHTNLQLCLQLDLPIVIAITKWDIRSNKVKQKLNPIVTAVKDAGRKVVMLADTATMQDGDLNNVSLSNLKDVERAFSAATTTDPFKIVPIIITSAVKGDGITRLHAVLRTLPIPPVDSHGRPRDSSPLFLVEDVYSNLFPSQPTISSNEMGHGLVVSGYLRYGTLRIGDELLIGPYPGDGYNEGFAIPTRSRDPDATHQSRSFPGALHQRSTQPGKVTPDYQNEELPPAQWRRVRVLSLRNLRMPVTALHADQVGTVGVESVSPLRPLTTPALIRVRKGMILTSGLPALPQAKNRFAARFEGTQGKGIREQSISSQVWVYFGSVRANAKIIAARTDDSMNSKTLENSGLVDANETDASAFSFSFDEGDQLDKLDSSKEPFVNPNIIIDFQLSASREYVEPSQKVLVIPNGGATGLEGFVGHILDE
jgi:hypothetical protein